MQKILLFSGSPDSSLKIRKVIEQQVPYKIFSVYDDLNLKLQLESKTFSLAIVNHGVVDEPVIDAVNRMKKSSQSFPVLIVADKVKSPLQSQLNLLNDIHILLQPTLDKNILGLVHKLLVARKVPKQNYRRFNTNEIAEMEALATGSQLVTNMYNLSKGGAYCEFDGQAHMAIGDMYRLKVNLSDTQSEYVFNAKVVWTTLRGRISGRSGCGLKFMNSQDTYRSLLSNS